ncbi:MAG: hypothetical protein U0744_16400 [Gemmataceae bacterium]
MTRFWLAGLLVVSLVSGCSSYGPNVSSGTIDVHYKGKATKEEAQKLANYLIGAWGDAPHRRTVQLVKEGDAYQFRMVVKKEFQKDDGTMKKLAFDAARISRDVFDGAPVELHACDEHLATLRAIPPRGDVRYGVAEKKVEVFYSTPTDKEDAARLAKYLTTIIDGNAIISFKLARRGDVVEVHMVSDPNVLGQPGLIDALQNDRKAIAMNAFPGKTVELHLCDGTFDAIRVLKD